MIDNNFLGKKVITKADNEYKIYAIYIGNDNRLMFSVVSDEGKIFEDYSTNFTLAPKWKKVV